MSLNFTLRYTFLLQSNRQSSVPHCATRIRVVARTRLARVIAIGAVRASPSTSAAVSSAMGALERRRPRPLTIARTPTTATTTATATTTTTTVADTRAADDDEGAATVGGRCGGGGGKSAARIAVERALGGAFDYKSVARDAVDGARDVRVSSSARGDDGDDEGDVWRSFASDDARAFAAETRREVERRIRAIDGEIERAARARRRDNHMFDGNRDDGDDDKDVRKVVKSRYLEAVNARREEFAKLHRAKTSVAFGSTIRA